MMTSRPTHRRYGEGGFGKRPKGKGYGYGSVRRSLGYKRPLPRVEAGRLLGGHHAPIQRRDLPPPLNARDLFIRGRRVGSLLEWRAWTIVKRLGWPDDKMEYQVDVLGGRMPGGRVLDIVVWTFGGPVVLAVNGDYWHARGERQKQLEKQAEGDLRKIFGSRTQYHAVYTADLLTDEIAYRTLLKLVGRY